MATTYSSQTHATTETKNTMADASAFWTIGPCCFLGRWSEAFRETRKNDQITLAALFGLSLEWSSGQRTNPFVTHANIRNEILELRTPVNSSRFNFIDTNSHYFMVKRTWTKRRWMKLILIRPGANYGWPNCVSYGKGISGGLSDVGEGTERRV